MRGSKSKKDYQKRITVSVFGLGHVGASIAAVWLRAGFKVIGVDISNVVVDNALTGFLNFHEPGVKEAFKKGLKSTRFTATTNTIQASINSDFKVVAVPVGILEGSTNLSAIKDVSVQIGKGLKDNDIVSINSSVPPRTTEDLVLPILERESGLKCEEDFALLYSPERVYEGRVIKDIEENHPTIVSGIGPKSLKIGSALYSIISNKGIIKMSSIRAAETEKLFEGVYRDVNIALANELAKLCEILNTDYWEIRRAANSQPYSHLHKPGTGVGGACIPIYPQLLMDTAVRIKGSTKITRLAREINSLMPLYCVKEALSLLPNKTKRSEDTKVTILGLAFRGGISDTRYSPSYDIIRELLKRGFQVTVHDPYVKKDTDLPISLTLTDKIKEAVMNADLIIIATDHPEYAKINFKRLVTKASLYDGRGILDTTKLDELVFAGVGRKKQQKH